MIHDQPRKAGKCLLTPRALAEAEGAERENTEFHPSVTGGCLGQSLPSACADAKLGGGRDQWSPWRSPGQV